MTKTLTLTARGVVTLPARIRAAAGFPPEGHVLAEVTCEGVLLRPVVMLPVEIYSPKRIAEFDAAEADLNKTLLRKKKR